MKSFLTGETQGQNSEEIMNFTIHSSTFATMIVR